MCSKRAVNWLCGSAQGTATHFTLCVGYSTRGSRQWGKVRNWHLLDSTTFGPRGPPCPLQATKFWAGEPGVPSGRARSHVHSLLCGVQFYPVDYPRLHQVQLMSVQVSVTHRLLLPSPRFEGGAHPTRGGGSSDRRPRSPDLAGNGGQRVRCRRTYRQGVSSGG
jgi:hypothetical protein